MGKDSDIQINKLNIDNKMKSITKSNHEIIATFNNATDIIVREMVSMVTRELNYQKPEKVKWKSILDGMLRWRDIINECVNLIDLENSEPIDDKKYLLFRNFTYSRRWLS